MAQRGEAGRALGLAAVSSICGGVISLLIFLIATPLLASIALSFRPMEYFALAVFALSMLASISGRSSLRNLISGAVGVLIGTVGIHLTTGVERFTFGLTDLSEGINFVPVLIGLFAISELLGQSQALNVAYERITNIVVKLPGKDDFKRVWGTILRSSGIGTFIGILPAEGATVAAIMGYNEARRWSPRKHEFGSGVPEGIAGPEAANNAATGGAMVPTLALGIPGSATTALILAALVMHGFRPGPYLMQQTPEFVYAIFTAMLIANVAFLGIGSGRGQAVLAYHSRAAHFSVAGGVLFFADWHLRLRLVAVRRVGDADRGRSRVFDAPSRLRPGAAGDGSDPRQAGGGVVFAVDDHSRQQLAAFSGKPDRGVLFYLDRPRTDLAAVENRLGPAQRP